MKEHSLHTAVVGINHRTGSVDLRDRLHFRAEAVPGFLDSCLSQGIAREMVIVSTCNRTELYAAATDPVAACEGLLSSWAQSKNLDRKDLERHIYKHCHDEAVRHLLRVVSSLDSLVMGEAQVFGQIKDAYGLAQKHNATGFFMNHLFQSAIRTGKRVRSETAVNEGAVSISFAAVELAKKVLGDLGDHVVGLIGSGEMGELAAKHLQKSGAKDFIFFNRSIGSAQRLAADFNGTCFALDELEEHLHACDIVLSATGSPAIVVNAAQVSAALRRKHGRSMFFIDIAAPRDIDPKVGDLNNAFLFTIDDLEQVITENVSHRQSAAAEAMKLIEEELASIRAWFHGLDVVPVIKDMRSRICELAFEEARRTGNGLDPKARELLERFSQNLAKKFLHAPTVGLKKMAERGEGAGAAYYAGELFSLNDPGKGSIWKNGD